MVYQEESATPGAGDRQVLDLDLPVHTGAGDLGSGCCCLLPGRLLGMDRYFLTLRGGEKDGHERDSNTYPRG